MVQIEQCKPEACVVTRAGIAPQQNEKAGTSTQLDWVAQEVVQQQVSIWVQRKPE